MVPGEPATGSASAGSQDGRDARAYALIPEHIASTGADVRATGRASATARGRVRRSKDRSIDAFLGIDINQESWGGENARISKQSRSGLGWEDFRRKC